MQYHQITSEERYAIAALRRQGLSVRSIARDLARAPSRLRRVAGVVIAALMLLGAAAAAYWLMR